MNRSQSFFLIAAIAALLFCAIASALTSDALTSFDEVMRVKVHSYASPPLTAWALNVTRLGSLWFLLPSSAVIAAVLALHGRRDQALFLTISMSGSIALENGLKILFGRLRPQVYFGVLPDTYAFPSGHALFSLCFYALLTIVVARNVPSVAIKAGIWIVATALVLAIGLTRIYMGVHYPSDVLGGYIAAIAWIALSLFVGERYYLVTAPDSYD
jgi:undecaprenyl-diphosphatase